MFVLDENKSYSIFTRLPIILFFISAVCFFIFGISEASYTTTTPVFLSQPLTTYGTIIQSDSAFFIWFIWQIIGAVASTLIYVATYILISYKIKQTTYLAKISYTMEKISNILSNQTPTGFAKQKPQNTPSTVPTSTPTPATSPVTPTSTASKSSEALDSMMSRYEEKKARDKTELEKRKAKQELIEEFDKLRSRFKAE